MIIAIASGKGGTGKTTVATALATVAGEGTCYADCDVEAPNGHIFLKPEIEVTASIYLPVPRVDLSRCTFCGDCRDACRFNAIAVLPKSVLIFDELCHGCGGCRLACPEKAIREKPREIGVVQEGRAGSLAFVHGRLNVGEAMSPPLIREVKRRLPGDRLAIVDAPPGTTCPVISAVHGADVCLLVTEPTPFGLNDLELAVEMVKIMGVPFGVVINRDGIGDDGVTRYCESRGIPILARIPEDRAVAVAYSKGMIAPEAVPEMVPVFEELLGDARALAARGEALPA